MSSPTFFSVAERPELRERREAFAGVWPEFMLHDPLSNKYWGSLYTRFPDFQLFAVDENDEILAEGNALPVPWEGELPDEGWDAMFEHGFDRAVGPPTLVSAIAIVVATRFQGTGLSGLVLARMRERARAHGFAQLIAPVRPSLKARYPLTAVERYIGWRTPEGRLFDPWLRVHERAGGELVRVAARSMRIPGSVADWESWTGMQFPESGDYVVPGALVPVQIDRQRDLGLYVEPNVWMRHRLVG